MNAINLDISAQKNSASSGAGLRLVTFGGLKLEGASFTRPKPLLLLAFLALEGPQDRRHLAELFWPGASNHMNSLTVALAQLRKGVPGSIETDTSKLSSSLKCDALAFLNHLDNNEPEDALALYTGPFLEGFYLQDWGEELEEWVYATRERLAKCAGLALMDLATQKAERGDFSAATKHAETAYKVQGDALEPDELRRLHSLLAAGGSAYAPEVAQELEAFDLVPLTTEQARATLQTTQALEVSSTLPTPPTPFIGRAQTLEELDTLLQTEAECRLLTLVGPGGIGKTRLAIELASRADSFAQGRFFIPLAQVGAAIDVVPTIADGLGLELTASTPPEGQLLTYLRDKALLLVLDNFEHLAADGGLLALLQDLLAGAPELNLLVTSRVQLGLRGEWVYPVGGLTFPEGSPPEGVSYDALTLFESCARRARSRFALEGEPAQLARLCQLVGGTPLALELAASWLHVLPLETIVKELEQGIDLLSARHSDVPERHRSMRAVLAGSWGLLSLEEANVLGQLAVFRGGFDRDAASQVAGATLASLAALVEKSLLSVNAAGRFFQHPLLQQYALEQTAETVNQASARHARYYLSLAEEASAHLTGPDQGQWLERLEQEHANLRLASEWLLDEQETELSLRLGAALWRFWIVRGHMLYGKRVLKALLELPRTDDFPVQRARVLQGLGTLLFETSEFSTGRDVLAETLSVWRGLGDKPKVAATLNSLAWVNSSLGELGEAAVLNEEALALNRALGEKRGVAVSLNNLGWHAVSQGRSAQAREAFEEALSLRRTLGDERGTGFALSNLAWALRLQGDYRLAKTLLDDALQLLEQLGDKQLSAWALQQRAAVALDEGDLARARSDLERSVALWREVGNSDSLAEALIALADVLRPQGDLTNARDVLREVASISERQGNWRSLAMELYSLGQLAAAEGNPAEAHDLLKQCLGFTLEKNARLGVAECLEALADIGKEASTDVTLLAAAQSLRQSLGTPLSPRAASGYEARLEHLRSELESSAFDAAWTQGQTVPIEMLTESLTELLTP